MDTVWSIYQSRASVGLIKNTIRQTSEFQILKLSDCL